MNIGINFNQVTYYEEVINRESRFIIRRKDSSIFGRDKGFVWENSTTLKTYNTAQLAIEDSGKSNLFVNGNKICFKPHVNIFMADGNDFTKYFPSRADMLIFIGENLSHCTKLEF